MSTYTDKTWGVPITFGNPNFDLRQESEWRRFYDDNGHVVIRDIISSFDTEKLKNTFLTDIENMVENGIKRDDPSTFTKPNRPGVCSVGIIKDPDSGFAHSLTAYTARKLSTPFFKTLYHTDKLQSSFDGGSIYPNWKFLPNERTKPSWLHIDQGHSLKDINCSQALLTLLPANETTGSLLVVPKSHKRHPEILGSIPYTKKNYIPLNKDNEIHKKIVEDTGLHLVSAPAGSLIVWNSRTIHSNTCALKKPTSNEAYLRLAIYVCMMPTREDEETLKFRKEALDNYYQTNHWTFKPAIKKEHLAYPRHKNFPKLKSVALDKNYIKQHFSEYL